jgi:fluoride exporter
MTLLVWCGVGGLGALGALLRFALDTQVQTRVSDELPLGTLAVNLSGALALGVLTGAHVGGDALLLAGTGLLGAYTTFSTLMFETQRLAEEDDGWIALAYLATSVAGGLACAALGWWIGSLL